MELHIEGLVSVALFYAMVLSVGLIAAWRRSHTKQISKGGIEVILAGRSIGLYVGAFTMTATWVSGGYISGTAESVYIAGFGHAQATWCYAISLILGGILFAKQMRERCYVTMLDPLQERYGKYMGGLLYLPAALGETFWSAAILSALGASLCVILNINMEVAVVTSASVCIAYTFFGGFFSVAYTDVIQLICIFFGLWLCIPFALTNEHVDKITETATTWMGTKTTKYNAKWFDNVLLLIFGGIPWQVYFQRVLASKSARRARFLSFVSAFACLVMAIPAVLIGAIASSTNWSELSILESITSDGRIEDTRMVLPLVIHYLTPPVVSFFGLGALTAAVMSSADSPILSAGSMFSYNIYKVIFKPKASPIELLWATRFGIVIIGTVATIMAIFVHNIYDLCNLCSDLVYVILFPQLLCAIHVPFVNGYGSFSAFFVGLLLRAGGGENVLNIPPFIKYPFFDWYGSNDCFPFRTFAMLSSLFTLLIISLVFRYAYIKGWLVKKYDLFDAFDNENDKKLFGPTSSHHRGPGPEEKKQAMIEREFRNMGHRS